MLPSFLGKMLAHGKANKKKPGTFWSGLFVKLVSNGGISLDDHLRQKLRTPAFWQEGASLMTQIGRGGCRKLKLCL